MWKFFKEIWNNYFIDKVIIVVDIIFIFTIFIIVTYMVFNYGCR